MDSRFKLVVLDFGEEDEFTEIFLDGRKRVLVFDEEEEAYFWCTKQQLIELVKEERCA